MVELTDFLKNLTSGNLQNIASQASQTPQTITRLSVSPVVSQSSSFQSALSIFDNLLKGGELPETFRQATTSINLLNLGTASEDISNALNEQITIRERQRAEDNEAFNNQKIFTASNNERISAQLTELGNSLKGGNGSFDLKKFFTDNPVLAGISVGGLVVGGVVLLLVLKK